MALVFLSYSRKDADFVRKLVDDLRHAHVPLWLDTEALGPGIEWPEVLENALEDCTHFLLVMSTASNRSKFVRKETIYAVEEDKTVVPVLAAACKPPLVVRDLQYIDFTNEPYDMALTRLLAALPQYADETPPPEPAAERHERFWTQLQAMAHQRLPLHDHITPPRRNTFAASAGVPGLKWRYVLHRRNASVQLEINTGDKARTRAIFDHLAASRKAIEAAFGAPLKWERLERQQASRISFTLLTASLKQEVNWPAAQAALIDAMILLEEALRPNLRNLPD